MRGGGVINPARGRDLATMERKAGIVIPSVLLIGSDMYVISGVIFHFWQQGSCFGGEG